MAGHEIVGVARIHEGWVKIAKLTIRRPQGGTMDREVEDHGSAVAVLPYDPERRTALLVRQFRAPVFHAGGPEALLETIAGILDEDDPEACARREAMEEAGLRLDRLESVGALWTSPGITTERMHLYLAPYAKADRVGEGGGLAEENEDIEVLEVPLGDLWAQVERGEILDLKTLALIQALRLRHPDLFGPKPPA